MLDSQDVWKRLYVVVLKYSKLKELLIEVAKMTRRNANAYTVKADIPLPHWLLASRGLSYGAKVACALVIHYTSGSAGTVISPSELAAEMGDEEKNVKAYLHELEQCGLIGKSESEVSEASRRKDFSRTQTKKPSPDGEAPTRKEPLSSYSFETCLELARRINESRGNVKDVYALAGHFFWTGTQDNEIAIMLLEKAASDQHQDKSSNVLCYRKVP